MNDEKFGKLVWAGDKWIGAVSLPYFRGSGKAIFDKRREKTLKPPTNPRPKLRPLTECALDRQFAVSDLAMSLPGEPRRSRAGPFDADRLFKQGKFPLSIGGSSRIARPPSRVQRDALQKVLDRGDAIWDELLDMILADYQMQRPVRVRWWKATYDDLPYRYELPVVNTRTAVKNAIRPFDVHIHPARGGASTADIFVYFLCPWMCDGFSVLIQDGKIIRLDDPLATTSWRPWKTVKHPALGVLDQYSDDTKWYGATRLESFREYFLIAEYRAKFRHDRLRSDLPTSLVGWSFAHGEFPTTIFTRAGELPRDAQVRALRAFKKSERTHSAALIDAIYKRYQRDFHTNGIEARADYPEEYVQEIRPDATGPADLSRCMELYAIHVHRPDKAGKVNIGFEFICSWGVRAFAVLWHDGKVLRIGKSQEGLPMRWRTG